MQHFRTATITALLLASPLALSACGGSTSTTATGASTGAASAPMSSPSMTSSMTGPMTPSASETSAMGAMPFGAACSAVPDTGKGSFSGMAADPVATAASNNPLLSTLVTAVTKAGLGSTLNSAKDITVFAPTNDAFKAVPAASLNKAMADPKGLLTKILTNHVVAGRLSPDQVAGTHKTLGGGSITVTGSGESFMVGKAKILCGNVQTANATVYIVDQVLLP